MLGMIATHVLQKGLASASLRSLAKSAGTSDRMLIYHFGNKDGLIGALLEFLTDSYSAQIDAMLPSKRGISRAEFLADIGTITRGPQFAPVQALWWEIVAQSARGEGKYRSSAKRVMDKLLKWIESHLPENDPDPVGAARQILTLIEGAQMLDAIGQSRIADVALARAFTGI